MPGESPPIFKENPLIGKEGAIYQKMGQTPLRTIKQQNSEHKTPVGSPTRTTERRKKPQDIQSDEQDKDLKMAIENSLLDQQDPETGGATLIDIDPEFTDPPEPQIKDSEPVRRGHGGHGSHGKRPSSHMNKQEGLKTRQESLKTKLDNSQEQRRILDKRLLKAESIIRERDTQINGLTAAITRLQSRDGRVARDDTYFANEFSDIANSIAEWTMRHFPKTKVDLISDLRLLPPELCRLILYASPNGEKLLAVRKSRLQIISSIVIDILYSRLFGGPLSGALEGSNLIQTILPLLKGNDFQIQRWLSLTNILITNSIEYEKNFSEDVLITVHYIDGLVSVLAPPESVTMLREADLYKLVDRAARASIEVRRQLDIISFGSPRPGDRFDSKTMEDIGQEDDPEDLEAGGATVQISLCPSVRRKICSTDGLSEGPGSLIMKAKVAIISPDD